MTPNSNLTPNGTKDKWEKIGEVQASGNSNSPKEYKFEITTNNTSYRLKIIDNDGSYKYSEEIKTQNHASVPKEFAVSQNYPNPYNPTTTISYQLPVDAKVRIAVYNTVGQQVKELVNENQTAGYKTVNFDATELSSGMYIYRVEAGKFSKTMKMMLVK